MARRKFTGDAGPAEIESVPAGALEIEIRRLQKLRAVLECLTFGLTYKDWEEVEEVDFADVASIALDLVSQSLSNLDGKAVGRSKPARRPLPPAGGAR